MINLPFDILKSMMTYLLVYPEMLQQKKKKATFIMYLFIFLQSACLKLKTF